MPRDSNSASAFYEANERLAHGLEKSRAGGGAARSAFPRSPPPRYHRTRRRPTQRSDHPQYRRARLTTDVRALQPRQAGGETASTRRARGIWASGKRPRLRYKPHHKWHKRDAYKSATAWKEWRGRRDSECLPALSHRNLLILRTHQKPGSALIPGIGHVSVTSSVSRIRRWRAGFSQSPVKAERSCGRCGVRQSLPAFTPIPEPGSRSAGPDHAIISGILLGLIPDRAY